MKLINDDKYTHPIGYAMKGYSLKVETIHDMTEYLRNVHQKNIPVLCECFDGQWANLAFKTEKEILLLFYTSLTNHGKWHTI